jgi:hypothetical protein
MMTSFRSEAQLRFSAALFTDPCPADDHALLRRTANLISQLLRPIRPASVRSVGGVATSVSSPPGLRPYDCDPSAGRKKENGVTDVAASRGNSSLRSRNEKAARKERSAERPEAGCAIATYRPRLGKGAC